MDYEESWKMLKNDITNDISVYTKLTNTVESEYISSLKIALKLVLEHMEKIEKIHKGE